MAYLPQPYRDFLKDYPKINEGFARLARACHEAGPLDEKTRRLVKLGVAFGLCSEGAIKSHTRRALELGATPEEVRHVALLALTTAGFPAMIAGLQWQEEVIKARPG